MSWPVVELGSVVSFIGGSQPPKSTFKYELEDGYVRLLQIRDYKSDDNLTYIPENSTKKFCSKDDVMIGRYGPPVFQILRGLEGAYNVALMKAQPSEKVDRDYLFYFLKQEKLFRLIDGLSQRTAGQSGVDMDALKAYPMLLPPLEEQKRIAVILDKADSVRRKRQQAIDLADDFLRSVFLDMFGDPVTNPKGFELHQMEALAEFINGDRSSNYPSGNDLVDEGVLFLNTKNIVNSRISFSSKTFITQEKFESLTRGKLARNDLVITLRGTLGSCAIFDTEYNTGFINAQIMIIRCGNKVIPEYLHALITSKSFNTFLQRIGQGAAVKQLTASQLKKLVIPLPPIDLQKKFLAVLSKAQTLQTKAKIADYAPIFNSLSQKAFAGEL